MDNGFDDLAYEIAKIDATNRANQKALKGAKVHRMLYGGGVMCEPRIWDEHRMKLKGTFDTSGVTCKRCLKMLGIA